MSLISELFTIRSSLFCRENIANKLNTEKKKHYGKEPQEGTGKYFYSMLTMRDFSSTKNSTILKFVFLLFFSVDAFYMWLNVM